MSLLPQPVSLLSLEFMTTALVVGFTDPQSPLRLACLPLIIILTWMIVATSIEHMRSPWAASMGGYASTYLLQYITIALLCKRNYPDPTAASSRANNNESFVESHTHNPRKRPTPTSSWARLKFGIQAASSFRWNDDAMTKRHRRQPASTRKLIDVFSKRSFILHSTSTITLCYLTLDLLSFNTETDTNAKLFASERIPLFTRLHKVTGTELVVRLCATLVSGIGIYALQQGLESLLAVFSVSIGMSEVEEWSPRFGSVADACSLRRFWGKVWHQRNRQLLSLPAHFITHNILRLPTEQTSELSRSITLLLTFLLSGLLHFTIDIAAGIPPPASGAIRFFLMQAGGMMIEDYFFHHLAPFRARRQIRKGTARGWIIGYVWVLFWLSWTVPGWLFPMLQRTKGGVGEAVVPFSLLAFLIRSIFMESG